MILQQIEQMPLPAGYRLEMPAHGLLAGQTKLRLIGFLAGALALVFLVIAAALESRRSAACVMVCVPAAWIGIALGFLWMEAPFGEGAFLGSILTLGLSVNAGIFLAHRYLQLRRARPNASPGLLALLSIRNRWRPMWTSTLCSVVALIPILLLPGAEPFWIGLAVSVVGGLLSSTALVPLAMVALFSRWSWTAEDSSSAPPPLSPSPG